MFRCFLSLVLLALLGPPVLAGTGYEVTSNDGEEMVTYMVNFGGGMRFEQYTAYDPASKSFVYLTWQGDEPKPEPACSIWDHQTGKTIALYQFPKVECPLPVIPSIQEMKVCPKTGDKDFKYRTVIAYD